MIDQVEYVLAFLSLADFELCMRCFQKGQQKVYYS